MDVHLAVASKRDVRAYSGEPLPPDTELRILDAGRLAGSARNRQPCRFVVAEGDAVAAVARAVYAPGNVLGASLVVAVVVTPGGGLVDFDAGRAAQNMMLAGWADGAASCPNGIADPAAMSAALGLEAPERAVVVIGFGPPRGRRDPARRSAGEWSRRARRLPLDAVVRRVGSGGR
jgi:nitroreductase